MRRFLGVLLLVATALPVAPATAASDAPVRSVTSGRDRAAISVRDGVVSVSGERAWPLGLRVPRGEGPTAESWRRSVAGTLVRLGAPTEVGTDVAYAGEAAYQTVEAAGDFDGDGARDLLATNWDLSQDAMSMTVTALRGRDGTQLWSRTLDGYAMVVPARVGTGAQPGVLLVAYHDGGQDLFVAGAGTTTTTVTAVAGDGTDVWTRSFEGMVADTLAGVAVTGVTVNVDLFDAVGNGAKDLMVTQLDLLAAPAVWRATSTASVVDGATGEIVASAQARDDQSSVPVAVSAGDLDASGGDDALFLVGEMGGGMPGRMTAFSSSDGRELWSREDLPVDPWMFIRSAGDMSGDGRDEILTSSFFGKSLVLDGGTGQRRWTRRGEVAYPVGDTNGDGLPEIGVVSLGRGYGGCDCVVVMEGAPGNVLPPPLIGSDYGFAIEMSVEAEPRTLGVTTRMIDADGDVVRRDRVAVPRPRGDHASRVQFELPGDVDGDDRADALVAAVVADMEREEFSSQRGLVSGRTGDVAWSPPLNSVPAGGAVDGAGDDVVTFRGPQMQLRDGRDGSLLWTSDVGRNRGVGIDAADVTGDGRADVLLTNHRGIRVLDGRTGEMLWFTLGGQEIALMVAGPR